MLDFEVFCSKEELELKDFLHANLAGNCFVICRKYKDTVFSNYAVAAPYMILIVKAGR